MRAQEIPSALAVVNASTICRCVRWTPANRNTAVLNRFGLEKFGRGSRLGDHERLRRVLMGEFRVANDSSMDLKTRL